MRNIIVFLILAAIIYVYSYIIGGENSMLMLYMLGFSALISAVMTLPIKNQIEIKVKAPTQEIERDGIVKVNVYLRNKSLLPIPFIEVSFITSKNFIINDSSKIRMTIGPLKEKVVFLEYKARARGVSTIGVNNIMLRDYLSVIKLPLTKKIDTSDLTGEITVVPRLYNLKNDNKLMMGSGLIISDEDEINSSNLFNWSGEPGHEAREYNAGDSLRKIHWKMSAKKETLMVRKDEAQGIPRKTLIIDPCIPIFKNIKEKASLFQGIISLNKTDEEQDYTMLEEKILESVLAVANSGVKRSGTDVFLYEDNHWKTYQIRDIKGVNALKYKFAAYQFNVKDNSNRFSFEDFARSGRKSLFGDVIIFTALIDNDLISLANSIIRNGSDLNIVIIKDSSQQKNDSGDKQNMANITMGKITEIEIDTNIEDAFSGLGR